MLFRSLLLSLANFCIVSSFGLPATSTELPQEGTCHVDVQFKGKLDVDKSNSVGPDGIEVWGETHITTFNCGQTKWPATKEERCFGFDELIGAYRYSTAYCLATDEDGDKILWKFVPNKSTKWSDTIRGSRDVLMASGKYKGMSGKLTYTCYYGGYPAEWNGLCDGEMTFKFPLAQVP